MTLQRVASPLVGRKQELAALLDQLAAVREAGGRVALVTGEPGIGKTRLVSEFAAHAQANAALVVIGHAYEGEGGLPYLPFVEVLRSLARAAPTATLDQQASSSRLSALLPELRQRLPDLPALPEEAPAERRFRLFETVADACLGAARGSASGLVLVLEDLHWADAASLAMLQHLGRRLAEGPVLLVATHRSGGLGRGHPLPGALAELTRTARLDRLRLRPLPADDVALLVESLAGRAPAPQNAARLSEETEGNPFLLTVVVGELMSAGIDLASPDTATQAWPVPDAVNDVVASLLSRMSPPAVEALEAAAILGDSVSLELLEAMTTLDGRALQAAIAEVVAAGLLVERDERYEFAHALQRHAISDAMGLPRRQQLHLRAAELMQQADGNPTAVAMHYMQAGAAAPAEKAAEALVRAGEAALDASAWEETDRLWRSALQVMQQRRVDEHRRAALLRRLGEFQFKVAMTWGLGITELEEAIQLYTKLEELDVAAELHCQVGVTLSEFGPYRDPARARTHFAAAERLLSDLPEQALHVQLSLGIAALALWECRIEDCVAAAQRAMAVSERLGNTGLWLQGCRYAGAALHWNGRLREGYATLERAAATALAQGFPALWTSNLEGWRGHHARYVLDPLDAMPWYRRALEAANISADMQTVRVRNHGLGLLLLGQIEPVPAVLPEVEHDPPSHLTLPSHVAFWSGDWDQAERGWMAALDEVQRKADLWSTAGCLYLLGRLHRVRGDLGRAAECLEQALEIEAGQVLCDEILCRTELVLALWQAGQSADAQPHLVRCREILANGEDWRGLVGRVALGDAVVAAASGRADDAERSFDEALGVFQRLGLPWEEAETQHCWARALQRAGQRQAASKHSEAAIAIYRKHGAGTRWVERVLANTSATTEAGRPHLPDGLSAREVEVLRLLATGKTNREIAEALVVSENTVATHIKSIFNKTGAANRTEAAAFAHRQGLTVPPS